jgi:hypothetical protein
VSPELDESIFAEVRGGPELLHWFGSVPSFHDAEILDLHLRRHGQSILRLHGWIMTNRVDDNGYIVLEKHAVVAFALDGVMDLQLEGFSRQNVIDGLTLRRAPERPERRNYLTLMPSPDDIEIELGHCSGLSGLVRARSVAITFTPGGPDAQMEGA